MESRESDHQGRERHHLKKQKKYEETALILDIIEGEISTRKDKYKGQTIVQAIGTNYFSLLEFIPTEEKVSTLVFLDKIELGKDERAEVETIIGRISYDKLTNVAEGQIEEAIDKILDQNQDRFVLWLNNAKAISIRLHSLQVIKGIGPKGLKMFLDARKQKEFESYDDFEERTGISDIKSLIKNRILEELKDEDEKYHLFTRPTPKEHQPKSQGFQRVGKRRFRDYERKQQ
jgi:putative nucleotide binding protein